MKNGESIASLAIVMIVLKSSCNSSPVIPVSKMNEKSDGMNSTWLSTTKFTTALTSVVSTIHWTASNAVCNTSLVNTSSL